MIQSLSALIQDLGCCFGQDTRQLILDGVPESSIRATDITPDYWSASWPCCLLHIWLNFLTVIHLPMLHAKHAEVGQQFWTGCKVPYSAVIVQCLHYWLPDIVCLQCVWLVTLIVKDPQIRAGICDL